MGSVGELLVVEVGRHVARADPSSGDELVPSLAATTSLLAREPRGKLLTFAKGAEPHDFFLLVGGATRVARWDLGAAENGGRGAQRGDEDRSARVSDRRRRRRASGLAGLGCAR